MTAFELFELPKSFDYLPVHIFGLRVVVGGNFHSSLLPRRNCENGGIWPWGCTSMECYGTDEGETRLRGFRRRWAGAIAAANGIAELGSELYDAEESVSNILGDCLGPGLSGAANLAELLPCNIMAASPVVLDPDCREPDWKRLAMQSSTSAGRIAMPSLVWEASSVSQVFRTGDKFQGTILSDLKHRFAPTQIGLKDVLHSSVI